MTGRGRVLAHARGRGRPRQADARRSPSLCPRPARWVRCCCSSRRPSRPSGAISRRLTPLSSLAPSRGDRVPAPGLGEMSRRWRRRWTGSRITARLRLRRRTAGGHVPIMPPIDAVTRDDLAYMRMHGRNVEGYLQRQERGRALRLDYGDEELEEIAGAGRAASPSRPRCTSTSTTTATTTRPTRRGGSARCSARTRVRRRGRAAHGLALMPGRALQALVAVLAERRARRGAEPRQAVAAHPSGRRSGLAGSRHQQVAGRLCASVHDQHDRSGEPEEHRLAGQRSTPGVRRAVQAVRRG